jgi:hypothetical protein
MLSGPIADLVAMICREAVWQVSLPAVVAAVGLIRQTSAGGFDMGGGMLRGVIGGLIGGIVGAAIWAAITYFTNMEIGWIAIGIGFVVGLGVRVLAGEEVGAGLGVMAALIAVVSIVAGKYAAIELMLARDVADETAMAVTAEQFIVENADVVVGEWEADGKTVAWPPGMTIEDAIEESHYPPEIWAEAKSRWDALGAEAQQQQIAEREALMDEFTDAMMGEIKQAAFKESFAPLDLLFFGLAVVTAFKVGSGMSNS